MAGPTDPEDAGESTLDNATLGRVLALGGAVGIPVSLIVATAVSLAGAGLGNGILIPMRLSDLDTQNRVTHLPASPAVEGRQQQAA